MYDLSAPYGLPKGVQPGSIDVALLVFVLSAVPPSSWDAAFANIANALAPGGVLLLRDYARLDLSQVRMKKGRMLDENYYRRGDDTLVYFATQEDIQSAATRHGLVVEQLGLDERLLVNRARQLRMNRAWLQAKLRKPHATM